MRRRRRIALERVDVRELQLRPAPRGAQRQPAHPPEPVDPNPRRVHARSVLDRRSSSFVRNGRALRGGGRADRPGGAQCAGARCARWRWTRTCRPMSLRRWRNWRTPSGRLGALFGGRDRVRRAARAGFAGGGGGDACLGGHGEPVRFGDRGPGAVDGHGSVVGHRSDVRGGGRGRPRCGAVVRGGYCAGEGGGWVAP
jgi:hypothetical protein